MSKVKIVMCDIKGCRKEADNSLEVMLGSRQGGKHGDGSYYIFSERNVDLCGYHELEYRQTLPNIKIDRKKQ